MKTPSAYANVRAPFPAPRLRVAILGISWLAGVPDAARGAISEYTSPAAFLSALAAQYPGLVPAAQDFSSLTPGAQGTSSLTFAGTDPLNGYEIGSLDPLVDFTGSELWVSDSGSVDQALSTITNTDRLGLSGGFLAVAGSFFMTDLDDQFTPGTLFLEFDDGSTFNLSPVSVVDGFRGYIADPSGFATLTVTGDGAGFVSVDDLWVLNVPEPAGFGAVVLGLGLGLGHAWRARRRRVEPAPNPQGAREGSWPVPGSLGS